MNKFNFSKIIDHWKIPSEFNQYKGALSIVEDRTVELKLYDIPHSELPKFKDIELLISSGITLYKCSLYLRHIKPGNSNEVILKVSFILMNYGFLSSNDFIFSKYSVAYTHLTEWVKIWGLRRRHVFEDESDAEFEFTYTRPEPIIIQQNESSTTQLQFNVSTNLKAKTSSITEEVEFNHTSKEATITLDQCIQEILSFRNFLFVLFNRPIQISYIRLLGSPQKIPQRGTYNPPIFLYIPESPQLPSKSPHSFPVQFISIQKELGTIYGKWKDTYQKLQPVLDIYIEHIAYSLDKHTNKFLNMVQAIETYHRRIFPNQEQMPRQNHEKRIEEILQNVPEEHLEFVQKRLNYSNEPTLNKRLKEFIEKVDKSIVIFLLEKKVKSFINDVKNTRNYLTHYSKESENLIMDKSEEKLGHDYAVLRQLLSYCIFEDLGILNDAAKAEYKTFYGLPKD